MQPMLHNARMTELHDSWPRVQAAFSLRKRRELPFLLAEVARRMAQKLEVITLEPQRIAVVGSGHDDSLALLRARYPQAQVVEVAASARLVADRAAARRQPAWRRALRALRGSAAADALIAPPDALPLPDESVDMLWCNLAPAWWSMPARLAAEWLRVLRPDGFVMFSALGPDTAREALAAWRAAGVAVDGGKLVDMHDWGDALVRAGFASPVMDMEQLTLTYADARAACAEWSALLPTRPSRPGLRSPRAWQALLAQWPPARSDGRVAMTAEVVYGHAVRLRPAARHSAIRVEDLRASLPSRRGPTPA